MQLVSQNLGVKTLLLFKLYVLVVGVCGMICLPIHAFMTYSHCYLTRKVACIVKPHGDKGCNELASKFWHKGVFFFLIEEHLVEKLRAFFRMKNLLLLMVCDHVFVFVCGE